MRYDLYRVSEADGRVHYAFVADDEHQEAMLRVQANGAPAEWVWCCEADSAEDANSAVIELMEARDWKL